MSAGQEEVRAPSTMINERRGRSRGLTPEGGALGEGEAAYRAAMASDDPDEAAYGALNLGSLLAGQGRFAEAEAALGGPSGHT